jgi:uncharacterized membrane protein
LLVRILRHLSIVVWVGGIIFFAFILAPVAFHLLPSQHEAGIVVGGTLRVLDVVGLVCGGIFWIATLVLYLRSNPAAKLGYGAQLVIVSVMMLATAHLHMGILPAMEVDRVQAGGDIEASPATNPAHIHFERLHKRSEQVEGAVLLCGLGIVVLMARESLPSNTVNS